MAHVYTVTVEDSQEGTLRVCWPTLREAKDFRDTRLAWAANLGCIHRSGPGGATLTLSDHRSGRRITVRVRGRALVEGETYPIAVEYEQGV